MADHGSRSRYVHGCRCALCTRANADYAAARKAGKPINTSTVTAPAGSIDLMAVESPDWYELAECRGAPAAVFFPEQGESAAVAKAVCSRCPVSVECLTWALDHSEKHGVWGGSTEKERKKLRVGWRFDLGRAL